MRYLEEKQSKCPACGSHNPSENEKCEICGTRLDLTEEEKHILDNLSSIPKVGRARAEKIITSGFSRVKDFEDTDIKDLTSVKGIGSSIAENILDFLKDRKDDKGELIICEKCGSLIGASSEGCPECDHTFQEEEKDVKSGEDQEIEKERCSLCGSYLIEEEDSCPVCGNPVREKIGSSSSTDRDKDEIEDYIKKRIEELDSVFDSETSNKVQEMTEEVGSEEDFETSMEQGLESLDEEETEEIVDEIEKLEEEIEDDREKDELRRYEAYPGELDDDKARIKSVIEEMKGEQYISTKKIEAEFDEMISHEEKGSYRKALDLAVKLLFDVEYLEIIKRQLDSVEDIKKDLSTEEGKKKLSKSINEIEEKCEAGEYEEALHLANKLEDLCEYDRREKLEKRFEKKLRRVRKNLKVARETYIDLKNTKINVKKSIESKKSGDLKEGITLLEDTLNDLEDIFVFSSKLEEAKGKLGEIRRSGGNTSELSQRLKKLKDFADEGDLEQANDRIRELLSEIDETKERLELGFEEDDQATKTDEAVRLESIKDNINKANEEPILSDDKNKKY